MKIIKQPIRIIVCPTCGCEFEWDADDLIDTTQSSCKCPRVYCPACKQLILIKDNKKMETNEDDKEHHR